MATSCAGGMLSALTLEHGIACIEIGSGDGIGSPRARRGRRGRRGSCREGTRGAGSWVEQLGGRGRLVTLRSSSPETSWRRTASPWCGLRGIACSGASRRRAAWSRVVTVVRSRRRARGSRGRCGIRHTPRRTACGGSPGARRCRRVSWRGRPGCSWWHRRCRVLALLLLVRCKRQAMPRQ